MFHRPCIVHEFTIEVKETFCPFYCICFHIFVFPKSLISTDPLMIPHSLSLHWFSVHPCLDSLSSGTPSRTDRLKGSGSEPKGHTYYCPIRQHNDYKTLRVSNWKK